MMLEKLRELAERKLNHNNCNIHQIEMIGFEPDVEECVRLNAQNPKPENRFFPIALSEKSGRRHFYITQYPSSCGFYPTDMKLMRRFVGGEENLSIIKTEDIETVDFDSFSADYGIDHVDFMKLDTEGSELDILKGAFGILNKSVIGVSVEVEFLEMHKKQPVFSDVDVFLRSNGFALFDLETYRIERRALPAFSSSPIPGSQVETGQIVSGEGLYLRDGVKEIVSESLLKDGWDDIRILKLASIMELFSLSDCAVELIQTAKQNGFLESFDNGFLIDLLVPSVKGKRISYEEYLQTVRSINERGYVDAAQRSKQLAAKYLPKPIRKSVHSILVNIRNVINKVI